MFDWYNEKGIKGDIVVSTRVRLARNLKDFPFPNRLDDSGREAVLEAVKSAASSSGVNLNEISISTLSKNKCAALAAKHIISPIFADDDRARGLLTVENGSVSIMVNEEDHIRLQVMSTGFAPDEAYRFASELDEKLSEKLEFAFSPELGYLTACPTNLGTAFRLSVMMHLPALTIVGTMNNIIAGVSKLGLTVRGFYGEGSSALGNLYQISNQVTLGLSEQDILEKLKDIVFQIIREETALRQLMIQRNRLQIADKAFRAYGILKYARQISTTEAMELISDVRLGVATEMFDALNIQTINNLMIHCQSGCIEEEFDSPISFEQRDVLRGELFRKALE